MKILVRHTQIGFTAWQIANVVAGLGLRVISIAQGHLGDLNAATYNDQKWWFIFFEVPNDSNVDEDDIDAAIDATSQATP